VRVFEVKEVRYDAIASRYLMLPHLLGYDANASEIFDAAASFGDMMLTHLRYLMLPHLLEI